MKCTRAVDMAMRRNFDKVILISPFVDMRTKAFIHHPWLSMSTRVFPFKPESSKCKPIIVDFFANPTQSIRKKKDFELLKRFCDDTAHNLFILDHPEKLHRREFKKLCTHIVKSPTTSLYLSSTQAYEKLPEVVKVNTDYVYVTEEEYLVTAAKFHEVDVKDLEIPELNPCVIIDAKKRTASTG